MSQPCTQEELSRHYVILYAKQSFSISSYQPHFPEEETDVQGSCLPMLAQLLGFTCSNPIPEFRYNHYYEAQLQGSNWGWEDSICEGGRVEAGKMGTVTPSGGDNIQGLGKQNEAQLGLARALAEPGNQRETHLRREAGDILRTILFPF